MKIAVRVSSDNQYYWLLPDDLLPTEYRKERPVDGCPQTVKLISSAGASTISMTEKIQRWLFGLNTGVSANKFVDLFDTWNVVGKIRDSANYITGERLDHDLPKYPIELTFAGNVVTGKEVEWAGGLGIPKGKKMLLLDTIHTDNLPVVPNKQHMTIIKRNVVDGRQVINPFQYNGGRNGKPCYTALLSNSPLYIEMDRVRKIPIGTPNPNPYWTEWRW